MQCTSDGHCSMLYVLCDFVSFFPFENGIPKSHKKPANLFLNNLRKFWKFTVLSISRFGSIKEVWYKDRKMSLYKPGQVRACFFWIMKKSNINQTKICFCDDNFRVNFFKYTDIFIFNVDFFSVNYWNYYNSNPDFNSLLGKKCSLEICIK